MTQEDVFKSIQENVSQSDGNGRMFLAVLLGAVGVVLLLVFLNARSKREATPKAVNSQGKLLKEIIKQVPIRPSEVKQLKLLADAEREAGKPIDNPLVFVLCPSAFTTAMRAGRVKVDRKVLAGLAKKMGLVTKK